MTDTKSPLMQMAWRALGQKKHWKTHMAGFGSKFKMDLTIDSVGRWDGDTLIFEETLDLGGGVTQDRKWVLSESEAGLHIDAEGIDLVRPGYLEDDSLVLVYRHAIQGKMLVITDKFLPQEDGSVKNMGVGLFEGAAVLKITSVGELVR